MKKNDFQKRYCIDAANPYILTIWGPVGKKLKEIEVEKNDKGYLSSKIDSAVRSLGKAWRQATLFDPKTYKRTVVQVNPNFEKERLKEKRTTASKNNWQTSLSRMVVKNPNLGL